MTSEIVYLFQSPFHFCFLRLRTGCCVMTVDILVALLPKDSPMLPQERDNVDLPSVPGEFVLLTRAFVSGAVIIVALKSTPFSAESALK